jgi:predicted transcriptional regulator
MRTLIDIPDDVLGQLDLLAKRHKRSRAAEVREALRGHLSRSGSDWITRGAGYWKHREDIGDAVQYQRAMRADRDDA